MKIPLRMRLAALTSTLCDWEIVNDKAHHFSTSHGVAKWLQVPGLLSAIARAATGDMSLPGHLARSGWVRAGWTNLLSEWLDEQILLEDSSVTKPTVIREGDRITSTLYLGVGLCLRRVTPGNEVHVFVSPTEDAARWISSRMRKQGGGVVRLLPSSVGGGRRSPYPQESFDSDDSCGWTLERTPWPDGGVWVEGYGAPTREGVARALFPQPSEKGVGRCVLLLGPPGAGKTETAVRACLLAHGQDARALVVHGSAFARGPQGMTGRDAVKLVRALDACALIVDDMPPTATVALLEEFEALHRERIAVAITLMTDGSRPRLPGLRPGRVDELIEFGLPDAEGRLALLCALGGDNSPAWESLSRDSRAEGMTPAYLRELASRVTAGGDPDKALSSLAAQRSLAT